MDEELRAYLEGMESRLVATLKAHVSKECEKVETKLLTEFFKWAAPTDQKLRSHREALRALDLEIEAIAGRVSKLESAREPLH